MAEYVSFSSRIFNFLSILEKIAVVVALLGIGFKYLHLAGGNEMLMLGLSGLAGVYFMFAYKPPEKTDQEEKPGFATLLIATILPKVSWIACSVLTIGVLFGVLNLSGSAEMLMIGVAAGVCAAVIFGLAMAQGNESAKSQVGVLYRIVPMLVIASYFMMPPSA